MARQSESREELFHGHTLEAPFSDLQLAHFVSYALCNYLTVPFPFTRPGFQAVGLGSHQEVGEIWRVLQVAHPGGFPVHTKVQKFYWGAEDFRLHRLDYVTDLLHGVAAHYCFDHKNFGGLLIPTVRRVVFRRDGVARLNGRNAFWLNYVEVTIIDESGERSDQGSWVWMSNFRDTVVWDKSSSRSNIKSVY